MFGRRSLISLLDVLANGLAAMLILWVAMMAIGGRAEPPASRGNAFRVWLELDDPNAVPALVVRLAGASDWTQLPRSASEVTARRRSDLDRVGPPPAGPDPFVLFGWSLDEQARLSRRLEPGQSVALPTEAEGEGSEQLPSYVALFRSPRAGAWEVGFRYASRRGTHHTWTTSTGSSGDIEVAPVRVSAASVSGLDVDPCARLVGVSIGFGEIVTCDPFEVEDD